MVQEPWICHERISGLNLAGYKLVCSSNVGKKRACMLIKNDINHFLLNQFSNNDITAVAVPLEGQNYWMFSCYMPYEGSSPPDECLRSSLAEAKRVRVPVLIGADANAHHLMWGSSDTNDRGESVFEFIMKYDLSILNIGNEPTFFNSVRREVIDITLVSDSHRDRLCDWRVSGDCSLSDHAYITYVLNESPSRVRQPYWDRRNTDWEVFKSVFCAHLGDLPTIRDTTSLDEAVDRLTDTYRVATDSACKRKIPRGKVRPRWWSPEIAALRGECRRMFNLAKSTNDWASYKLKLREFKSVVRKAKRSSWRSFCEDIEESSEAGRLRRLLAKTGSNIGSIRSSDGSWTNSNEETLKVLLDAHFHCSRNSDSPDADATATHVSINLSDGNLRWAIGSFKRYKSPGTDGIIPADLQETSDMVTPWLRRIYFACLKYSYVPVKWREARVVFIPKAGKPSISTAKDLRPISLTSFLLKTLERILDNEIRSKYFPALASSAQHAYTRGRSTETALSSLVGSVEKALAHKIFSLAAFIDVEGAFNNVHSEAVVGALRARNVDECIVGFVGGLLSKRIISASIGEAHLTREVDRGTPQGGVLSPLLWNIVAEDMLEQLQRCGFKVFGYADDLAILVSGIDPQTLSLRCNQALKLVSKWCLSCGLSINPHKTELMLFTRKYKTPAFDPPSLNGVRLTLSKRVKYLGVILDPKLSWRENVTERVKKATVALYTCKRAVGRIWGLRPTVTHWLYRAVVEPILLYGAHVWWTVCKYQCYCGLIDRVRRQSAVLITGALCSTPTKALFAILNWLPTDLLLRQRAKMVAVRLHAARSWPNSDCGHAAILGDHGHIRVDYMVPYNFLDREFDFKIPTRDFWSSKPEAPNNALEVYTDGSRMLGRVGCGVYIEGLDIRLSYRLPDHCSVFQAEVMAILKAVQYLLSGGTVPDNILIYSDSQAAIRSLTGVISTSILVHECRGFLSEISDHSKVTLIWVPGHRDVHGNCVADELARAGTQLEDCVSEPNIGSPIASVRLDILRSAYTEAQFRWRHESTCHTARLCWSNLDKKRTNCLLSLNRVAIGRTIAVLTGHCPIGRHAERLGIPSNDFCRSCGSEEEEETVFHLMCQCPALAMRRHRYLSSHFLSSLTDLSTIGITAIARFIVESGWFPTGTD